MNFPTTERISKELALRKRLQEGLIGFTRGVSARLALDSGLETLAHEINALFGTTRTSVWLHDRRTNTLHLAASSDTRDADAAADMSTEEDSPIARSLRHDGPQITGTGAGQTLVAPLRGWRRALGTIVVEGQPRDVDEQQLVELSMDLARQLSSAVESVIVLDELIRQHRLLEDTFDSLADMVVVTDAEGRAVQLNSALAARIGARRADLVHQPLETMVGPAIAQWAAAQASGQGEIASREFVGQPLADAMAATATAFVSQAGGPVGRVLVLRDISEQVRLRERAAQTEKLASLGQFIAGIAHEMNNPLQSVLGHLELMLQDERHATHRTDLRRAYHDADRAAKIVRNLLVFSGSRRVKPRRVNIERLLSRVVAMRKSALHQADVDFVREGALDLPDVSGDAGLLQQALLNVLINGEQAIAETSSRGQITITTSVQDDVVVLAIADSGPGIPPSVLPRIFDPFFTTKDVGQGSGLGLAITYGIMQEHKGSITAASGAGGAVFTLQLPIAD
ncbi:MAG: GAF domain-containing protein [Acidobacteria bacterium]|nr:GAF domain-containing protein [Acidobacteriota bacterium]